MQRRKFNREFKLEAVRLVKERGVSIAQASRDLDVHEVRLGPENTATLKPVHFRWPLLL